MQAVELLAVHEVEELLEARLDLHRLDDVVEIRPVQRHIPAERDRNLVWQAGVQDLVQFLDEAQVELHLLGLGFLLDEIDDRALVADLGEGVDHRAVHHAGVGLERLAQLGVGQDHAFQRALVVNP